MSILVHVLSKTRDEMAEAKLMFDLERFKRLEAMYDQAVKNNIAEFDFDGHRIVTAYANYMLQYLRTKLKPH